MYAEAAINAGKHVFVEKPHGIDPVGCRRMQAACDLAKQKGLSLSPACRAASTTATRRPSSGSTTGPSATWWPSSRCSSAGRTGSSAATPSYTETQYQFSNWYHFCWLSGDDVTQSLVHNIDRIAWILKEEMPNWCFGLGGRSASFGEVYGDMFDHHTAVYEYASGARVYALCRTQDGCYGNSCDIVMGTKGTCYLGDCRIDGQNKWQFTGAAQQSLRRRAEGPDRRGPQRQADQQRLPHGQQHDGGRAGATGLLQRQAD